MTTLTLPQVFASDYGLQAPLTIELGNGERLQVEKVLRYLPGKRLACKVNRAGREQFIKLFHPQKGSESYQSELRGYELLKAKGINTPRLLENLRLPQGLLLAYEFLEGAVPLTDVAQAFTFITRLHDAGLVHTDIHFDNLMAANEKIYLLDIGAVRTSSHENDKIKNLALFIAQAPLSQHGALMTKTARSSLAKEIHQSWQARKKSYLEKIFRNCTEIQVTHNESRLVFVKRQMLSPALKELIQNPDRAMEGGDILKDGNSQTVAKVFVDGRSLVIKRYNQKTFLTLLKRKLGITRARNCWRHAHLLEMVGIRTPAPVAVIENVKGATYYISSYTNGNKLSRYHRDNGDMSPLLPLLKELFDTMHLGRLVHGDLKASNILIADKQLWLIDLDVMAENPFNYSYRRNKDEKRFLQNFEGSSCFQAVKNCLMSQTR